MTAYERIGIAREFDARLKNSSDALSARIRIYARRGRHERPRGGLKLAFRVDQEIGGADDLLTRR